MQSVSLPGRVGPAGDAFAYHLLAVLKAFLGVAYDHQSQLLADLDVLVQPQAEGVLDGPGHEGGALPRRKALLGLAGELRVVHLD